MSSSTKTKTRPKEHYLKIPNHILNLRGVSLAEKVLLAHFYSFGIKGCWQSNATLAEMFMTSRSSISRSIAALKKAGLIAVRAPKGWHRTIWARSHPQVPAARTHLCKNAQEVRQEGTSKLVKSVTRVTQKCVTTNNNTIIDNNKDTTTTPPPLPAGGQAPALLADRRAQALERIAAFTRGFGRTPRQRMTPQEFEKRRRQMIKALRSV